MFFNRGKRQFSDEGKKAFYQGQAYAAGKAGVRVNVQGTKNKRSFLNGVAKQCEKMKGKRG